MFSGQNSAASLRTGRPNIEIFVETEVMNLSPKTPKNIFLESYFQNKFCEF